MIAINEAYPITVLFNAEEQTLLTGAVTVATIRQELEALMNIPSHAIPRLNGMTVEETAVVAPHGILEFVVPWGSKGGGQYRSSIDLQEYVPKEIIESLAVLGQHRWMRCYPRPDGKRIRFEADIPTHIAANTKHSLLFQLINSLQHHSPCSLVGTYAFSQVLGHGPKVLQPTEEQCVALEHTDVRLGLEEYRQPFPSVIVELPATYRQTLSERYGTNCPAGIMQVHDESEGYIITVGLAKTDMLICRVLRPAPGELIENALSKGSGEALEADIALTEVLTRIGLNFCLMMMEAGVVKRGVVDPQRYERHRQLARGKNALKARRSKLILRTMPRIIEFERNVEFFVDRRTLQDKGTAQTSGGTPKSLHWRRGHWRLQRCGPGCNERKRIFIRPVLIHGDQFAGKLQDTRTSYSGKRRN